MANRMLDLIAAALLLAAMAWAGSGPVPGESAALPTIAAALIEMVEIEMQPAAYRAALECPQYDCGEE